MMFGLGAREEATREEVEEQTVEFAAAIRVVIESSWRELERTYGDAINALERVMQDKSVMPMDTLVDVNHNLRRLMSHRIVNRMDDVEDVFREVGQVAQ